MQTVMPCDDQCSSRRRTARTLYMLGDITATALRYQYPGLRSGLKRIWPHRLGPRVEEGNRRKANIGRRRLRHILCTAAEETRAVGSSGKLWRERVGHFTSGVSRIRKTRFANSIEGEIVAGEKAIDTESLALVSVRLPRLLTTTHHDVSTMDGCMTDTLGCTRFLNYSYGRSGRAIHHGCTTGLPHKRSFLV